MTTLRHDVIGLGDWLQRIGGVFEEMNLEVPAPDVDLFATGVLDSMAFVELLVQFERHFEITFRLEDLDLDRFRSLRAMAGHMHSQRAPA